MALPVVSSCRPTAGAPFLGTNARPQHSCKAPIAQGRKRMSVSAKSDVKSRAGRLLQGLRPQRDPPMNNLTEKTSKSPREDRVAGELDGLVASPLAYAFLGLTYAISALPATLSPHDAANFLFGAAAEPHVQLHEPLFRIQAGGLFIAAAIAFALRLGARKNQLGQSAYQRLEIGLILFATANVLLETTTAAQPGSVLTFPSFWTTFLLMGATVAIAWGGYGQNSDYGLSLKRSGPLPAIKKVQDDTVGLASSTSSPRSLNTLFYSIFTIAFAGTGAGYLLAPEATLKAVFAAVEGPENVFLWRAIGAALLILGTVTTYTLKEAAQARQLNERTYKVLNAGLAIAASGHLLALGPIAISGEGGWATGGVLGVWVVTGVTTLFNLLTSAED